MRSNSPEVPVAHYRFIQRSYSASHNACENINYSSSSHELCCLCVAIFSRCYYHHIVFFFFPHTIITHPPLWDHEEDWSLVEMHDADATQPKTMQVPPFSLTLLRPFWYYKYFLAINQILWATDDQNNLNYIFKTFSSSLLFSFAQPLSSCAFELSKRTWFLGK